jgi:hypothetical protein
VRSFSSGITIDELKRLKLSRISEALSPLQGNLGGFSFCSERFPPGFATADFIAWKLIVIKAITIARKTAATKIHN